MANWKSEEVLNKWLEKEKEDREYVEEHMSEMGEEIDAAFHEDLIRLLERHGVDTSPLITTVDILNAIEGLITKGNP